MQKNCLKCGHVNTSATGDDLETCPSCGAIYSRVEAALKTRQTHATAPVPAPPARRTPAPNPFTGKGRDGDFLEQLRRDSNYPTFRSVVGFFTWFGYVIAVLVAIGAVMTMWKVSFVTGWMALVAAIAIFVFARLGKEIWLMVADGCDALVRMAAQQERN